MKIIQTNEIDAFFTQCKKNIYTENLNQFLGKKISKGNESYLIKKLARNGAQEFQKDAHPSIWLSTQLWEKSPYHQNIHLDQIKDEHFTYEEEIINGGELFNAYAIQPDQDKMLNDWIAFRAMDQDTKAIYLLQDDEVWMMDVPGEANTINPCAEKAHGKVITFGLGIGYFIYMTMLNPDVTSITVVEKSKEVIHLFETAILPQFPKQIPITIIEGDALDYFKEETLKNYDYIFADIWQSSDDGLYWMRRLLQQYNPPFDQCDFWIEDSCIVPMRTLICLALEEITYHKTNVVSPDFIPYMKAVRNYLKNKNETIETVSELKDLMYDTSMIRDILAQKG